MDLETVQAYYNVHDLQLIIHTPIKLTSTWESDLIIKITKAGFLLQGAPPQKKTTFAPLKFSKNNRKNIETVAYCFKNNDLLSFAPPPPLKFFSSRKPDFSRSLRQG